MFADWTVKASHSPPGLTLSSVRLSVCREPRHSKAVPRPALLLGQQPPDPRLLLLHPGGLQRRGLWEAGHTTARRQHHKGHGKGNNQHVISGFGAVGLSWVKTVQHCLQWRRKDQRLRYLLLFFSDNSVDATPFELAIHFSNPLCALWAVYCSQMATEIILKDLEKVPFGVSWVLHMC